MAARKDDWEAKLAKVESALQTATILEWLIAAKWPGASFAPAWEARFAKLVALNDSAAIEPLRAMAQDMPAFLGAKHRTWIAEKMISTADAIKSKGKSTKASAPIVLKKPGASKSTMSIVQRVFDAPEDGDLRRVVADQLLEQGDPWGEFIQLGFLIDEGKATPEQNKLAEKLAQKNSAAFAGPLAKIATVDSREYDRGFLKRVRTSASMVPRPAWEAAATTPYWSTVMRVEIDMTTTPKWWTPAFAKNPALRHARELTFNRYAVPLISLERAKESAPWRVVSATNTADGWLRFLRDFMMVLPEGQFEVAAIPERSEILQRLKDLR